MIEKIDNNQNKLVEEIQDNQLIKTFEELINKIVEKPNHLSIEWLKQKKWFAIPVPDSINSMDAEWIANAAQKLNHTECFALSTDLEQESVCLKIKMTQEALLDFEFNPYYSTMNFVLFPKDISFAIMRENGYYFVVAGEYNFVHQAIGCSFRTARMMFLNYINDEAWSEKTRSLLLSILARYEHFNDS
jgi:hypothetical protein